MVNAKAPLTTPLSVRYALGPGLTVLGAVIVTVPPRVPKSVDVSVPPCKLTLSAPIDAEMSSVAPDATMVPLAVVPRPLALVTFKVPALMVVIPV